jgi:hypothetical protein
MKSQKRLEIKHSWLNIWFFDKAFKTNGLSIAKKIVNIFSFFLFIYLFIYLLLDLFICLFICLFDLKSLPFSHNNIVQDFVDIVDVGNIVPN